LPSIELARIGNAHFEAQARELEILTREADVLSLDAFFGFGAQHRHIGRAGCEHDVEHVHEVSVLPPLL
jgi:hypothetical protein